MGFEIASVQILSVTSSKDVAKSLKFVAPIVGFGLFIIAAAPALGQYLPPSGGGAAGGGGLTGGVFALGNTTNSSSGIPADASLSISGLGNVSVGMSGSVLLISGTETTNGSIVNLFALGNTTGLTSSTTASLTQLTFSGAGGASLGYTTTAAGAGVILVSAPTTVASATSGAQIAIGNTTGATSSESTPVTAFNVSGAGGNSVGFSNGTFIISGAASATSGGLLALGNTTGLTSSTTNVLTNLSVSGAGGVSVGYSTTGAGAPQLIISGATGGGGAVISNLQGPIVPGLSQTLMGAAAGSFTQEYLIPLVVPASLVLNQAHILGQFGVLPGNGWGSSTGSKTGSGGLSQTFSVAVYAETAPGAFATTGILTSPIIVNASLSQTGASWSETQSVTYPSGSGTASSTFSISTNAVGYSESEVVTKWLNYASQNRIDIGASAQSTLSPGNYMLGLYSTGSTAGSSLFTSGGGGLKPSFTLYAALAGALGGANFNLTDNIIGGTSNEPIWFIGTIVSSNSSSFAVSQVGNFSTSNYGGFYVTLGAS